MPITGLMPKEPTVDLSPPVLNGYTFEPSRAYQARDQGRLLTIQLETNLSCNLNCRYCYAESSMKSAREADLPWMTGIIRQAQKLGAESIVVIGGGEPTIHPKFRNLIEFIDDRGLIPVVFTNSLNMSRNLALFLYHHNASVVCKLDSLRPWVQDFLVRRPGALDLIQRGMRNLRDMGFTSGEGRKLRLGVSFVCNRLNLGDTEGIWRFARESRIFPHLEILNPTGRTMPGMGQYLLTREEIRKYKLHLLTIDREEYGYDWLPFTPLAGSGCLQHLYSLYITIDGDVRPCAHTAFDQHPALKTDSVYPFNVNRMPLEEIYRSDLFASVRTIDSHLDGKCRNCDYHSQCIGCRGYAYSMGVNEGLDPYAALRQECRQCFKYPKNDADIDYTVG